MGGKTAACRTVSPYYSLPFCNHCQAKSLLQDVQKQKSSQENGSLRKAPDSVPIWFSCWGRISVGFRLAPQRTVCLAELLSRHWLRALPSLSLASLFLGRRCLIANSSEPRKARELSLLFWDELCAQGQLTC